MLSDPRKESMKRVGLDKMVERKKNAMPLVLAHLAKASELFYEYPLADTAPLKNMIEVLIVFTPEMVHFLTKQESAELKNMVKNLVVEELFKSGQDGLRKMGAV